MVHKEQDSRKGYIMQTAEAMMAAARTAPKGRGIDNLVVCVMEGSELRELSERMKRIGNEIGQDFFIRDAGNVEVSDAVVFIGAKHTVRGLDCSLCGYPTCAEKSSEAPRVPCVFNVTDLGIAIGSAVSVAADRRVDNRVMYSAGIAGAEMGVTEDCTVTFAIPLSCSGKSIFFDRKHK